MRIKLLSAVMHDGERAEAGQIVDVDAEIAESLIASGAAVKVEEIPDVPPALPGTFPGQGTGDQAPAAPASLTPESGLAALVSPPDAGADAAANAEPAPAAAETKPAEPETGKAKAAKAEGK